MNILSLLAPKTTKHHKLVEAYKKLKAENAKLENRIIDLDESLSALEDEIEALKLDMVSNDSLSEKVDTVVENKLDRYDLSKLDDLSEIADKVDEISDVVDNYDFDEFMTESQLEDYLDRSELVSYDDLSDHISDYINDEGLVREIDLEDCVNDSLHDTKKEIIEQVDRRLEECTNLSNPEIFRIFLNNLAKYVMEQTKSL